MPRVAGIDIPTNKRIDIALTYLYGIGRHNALDVLTAVGIDPAKRASNLTGEEISKMSHVLEKFTIEGELRKTIRDNIERLKRTGSYRGLRHSASLPVRGQRTRTNARTKRGKRMTIGALKKEDATKVGQQQTQKEKEQ